ncbi:HSP33 family (HslO) (PDB:1HW7) [Commensalibacter communis]|uniref:HSP33 family (HslO) n=1 Tax=Commensalibacter communis TaxID=2972786 RepID=A0A9W4XCB2_9PROT|nr:Hsp33 family molecular chaperone HslO [Commensalibacter communis]CAI3925853.1 HSP33 family (HslO) (PDB:1HW7) [Commensalibacter communis]CAI3927360.1 HSP33 family (HslO) (PDB:1HW7) [Commensalibacter communis]CAI3927381.1 HSP33 family (HslO) (PDB:1HW7) [Commensalibacter communis]CAI3935118.1 HSP33 family (HslO) (PDB:1HW7) [Commensalibacter communis]CAI3935669.1 HSP33 family (HslO) (PDB:1HW7) [Commensalibacter communis]
MTKHTSISDRPDVPELTIPEGITPFFFPSARGRLIRLGALANTLLERHQYPYAISKLGGEALALVAGLAAALKFEGSFSLQVKGEGAVSLLVVDCTHNGELRFYARFDEEKVAQLPKEASALELFEKGLFALTVDQHNDKDTYQGMVKITGNSLSEMASHYFESSEQLSSWIRLYCEHTSDGWEASGLILEKIANDPSIIVKNEEEIANEAEEWNTLTILAETMTSKEMLDQTIDNNQLLYRLFNSTSISIGTAKPVSYGCRCSRSRLENLLKTFSKDDIDTMNKDGNITMTCEFCRYDFIFKPTEI